MLCWIVSKLIWINSLLVSSISLTRRWIQNFLAFHALHSVVYYIEVVRPLYNIFLFLRKDFTSPKNTFKKEKIAYLTFDAFYDFYTHLSGSCLFLFVLICAYLCLFMLIYPYLCLVICAQENENYYNFFLFTPRDLCTSRWKLVICTY